MPLSGWNFVNRFFGIPKFGFPSTLTLEAHNFFLRAWSPYNFYTIRKLVRRGTFSKKQPCSEKLQPASYSPAIAKIGRFRRFLDPKSAGNRDTENPKKTPGAIALLHIWSKFQQNRSIQRRVTRWGGEQKRYSGGKYSAQRYALRSKISVSGCYSSARIAPIINESVMREALL